MKSRGSPDAWKNKNVEVYVFTSEIIPEKAIVN
jgi:AMMECR1 domain-containing protein